MTQQVYAIDELMSQTRKLAAQFHQTTAQTLPVSGELARFDACQLLGLQSADNNNDGIDAFDSKQQGVLIKSRVLFKDDLRGYRIGQVNLQGKWQSIALVLYNAQYEPIEIYQLTRDQFIEAQNANENSKSNKRGAMSVAKFRAVGECVWPKTA